MKNNKYYSIKAGWTAPATSSTWKAPEAVVTTFHETCSTRKRDAIALASGFWNEMWRTHKAEWVKYPTIYKMVNGKCVEEFVMTDKGIV
jgi:hypothetical protein